MRDIVEAKISNTQFSAWKHAPAWLYERWLASRDRIARIEGELWWSIVEQEELIAARAMLKMLKQAPL